MARKLRVGYPGAIYCVMNRGDRREPIFRDNANRQRFVETLAEVCAQTGLPREIGVSTAYGASTGAYLTG